MAAVSSAVSSAGMNCLRTAISASSFSASSGRPAERNCSAESSRCLICLRTTASSSASSSRVPRPPLAMAVFVRAVLRARRVLRVTVSFAFMAVFIPSMIWSEILFIFPLTKRIPRCTSSRKLKKAASAGNAAAARIRGIKAEQPGLFFSANGHDVDFLFRHARNHHHGVIQDKVRRSFNWAGGYRGGTPRLQIQPADSFRFFIFGPVAVV